MGIKTLLFIRVGRKSADTHVLIRADQEPMMNVSLYEAGLPHTLLSQHYNFGIHTDGTHSNWVRKSPGIEINRDAGVGEGQFTSFLCGEKAYNEFVFSDKIKDIIWKSKLTFL